MNRSGDDYLPGHACGAGDRRSAETTSSARKAWSRRVGMTSVASTWTEYRRSSWRPRSRSSLPDGHSNNLASMLSDASRQAATAARASGDSGSGSLDSTAPAPRRSSKAGRSDWSGHRSPQAITLTDPGCEAAHSPMAVAFRKHAAATVAPVSAATAAHVEPFGDGRTTASPASIASRLIGESDGPNGSVPSASFAPTDSENATADSSRQR